MTTTPQIKDKTEYAYAKSNIYQLLSTAFAKELTHESIEIFRGNDIAETLKNFGEGFDTEFYKCTTENVLKELSDEYAALFILPGGVNPTESVARAGLYMQVYAAQVLRFYHQCGFSLSDGFK
ncbi:MAG: molecular chaperone TorD family protein, partial [Deltaproteobacteria bacterium]|nr:molecular chaperone TorD family protein [Deltaproteobacteria bacterium]